MDECNSQGRVGVVAGSQGLRRPKVSFFLGGPSRVLPSPFEIEPRHPDCRRSAAKRSEAVDLAVSGMSRCALCQTRRQQNP